MTTTVRIGTYHVSEGESVTRCPSYYAADTETLALIPGDYPLRLSFEGGYLIPMPYWVLASIDAIRTDGRTYSGFCGNNFASRELPKGEKVTYTLQAYTFQLEAMIASGHVTLDPEFAWVLTDRVAGGPRTWDEIGALSERG